MKKTRFILFALTGVLLTAFSLSAQLLSANVRAAVNVDYAQPNQIMLRDALQKFKNHFGVDILFEEKVLEGVTISSRQLHFGNDAEKDLEVMLQNSGLRLKKIDKKTFVILSDKSRQSGVASSGNLAKSSSSVIGRKLLELTAEPEPISTENEVVIDRVISGQVVSETGEELPGVSILVKGTQTGTVTDDRGNFTISIADDNTVLIFSFIGYVREEITVGTRTRLDVVLKTDNLLLNETVIVGYGEVKK